MSFIIRWILTLPASLVIYSPSCARPMGGLHLYRRRGHIGSSRRLEERGTRRAHTPLQVVSRSDEDIHIRRPVGGRPGGGQGALSRDVQWRGWVAVIAFKVVVESWCLEAPGLRAWQADGILFGGSNATFHRYVEWLRRSVSVYWRRNRVRFQCLSLKGLLRVLIAVFMSPFRGGGNFLISTAGGYTLALPHGFLGCWVWWGR